MIKELVESAPVIAAVRTLVHDGAALVKDHFWSKAAVVPYRGVSAPFALSAAAGALGTVAVRACRRAAPARQALARAAYRR